MTNELPAPIPKDKLLGSYPAFTPVADKLWLVRETSLQKVSHWALYAPEQGAFLSPFMYKDFELPNGKAPLLCCLFTVDRVVRFHIEEHFCPLC